MNVIQWINLGLTVAEAALRGVPIAIKGRDMIQRLVAEGRNPTDEEWDHLNSISLGLHAAIQGSR